MPDEIKKDFNEEEAFKTDLKDIPINYMGD